MKASSLLLLALLSAGCSTDPKVIVTPNTDTQNAELEAIIGQQLKERVLNGLRLMERALEEEREAEQTRKQYLKEQL